MPVEGHEAQMGCTTRPTVYLEVVFRHRPGMCGFTLCNLTRGEFRVNALGCIFWTEDSPVYSEVDS